MNKSIVLWSGGMDSTSLLWEEFQKKSREVHGVSVCYGQRHAKELAAVDMMASEFGVAHHHIAADGIRDAMSGSCLIDDAIDAPHGHYEDPSMGCVVVPNRNMILLSLAIAHAVSIGADRVCYAAHVGDHAIYPDCRPEFIDAMCAAAALCSEFPIEIVTPYRDLTKANICKRGNECGAPLGMTWSCYEGGDIHCGRCGTCIERREAFYLAGVDDSTGYADKTPIEQLLEVCSED